MAPARCGWLLLVVPCASDGRSVGRAAVVPSPGPPPTRSYLINGTLPIEQRRTTRLWILPTSNGR